MIQEDKDELSGKVVTLKVRLSVLIEKLITVGQENFARQLYLNLRRLNAIFDKPVTDVIVYRKKMKEAIGSLTELENILLACKVGIGLPDETKTMEMIKELKNEISERIIQENILLN